MDWNHFSQSQKFVDKKACFDGVIQNNKQYLVLGKYPAAGYQPINKIFNCEIPGKIVTSVVPLGMHS